MKIKTKEEAISLINCYGFSLSYVLRHCTKQVLSDIDVAVEAYKDNALIAEDYINLDNFTDTESWIKLINEGEISPSRVPDAIKQNSREIALELVKSHPSQLSHLPNFQDDEEVVLTAVSKNGLALKYASENQKNNNKVILTAVKQNGKALESVPENKRRDEQIWKTAITTTPSAIKFVPEDIRDNEITYSMWKGLLKQAPNSNFAYLPTKYFRDSEKQKLKTLILITQSEGIKNLPYYADAAAFAKKVIAPKVIKEKAKIADMEDPFDKKENEQ